MTPDRSFTILLDALDSLGGEANTTDIADAAIWPRRDARNRLYALYLSGVLERPRRGGPGAGTGHGLVWRRARP